MRYRYHLNSAPAVILGTAVVLFFGINPAACGDDSPQVANQQAFDRLATSVPLNLGSYAELKDRRQFTIADFTLDDGSAAELELDQIEIFAPDATILAGTKAGDIPLPRPLVALFRGRVSGRPDSRVFLSLSPFGVYGMIGLDGATRVITSGLPGDGHPPVLYNLTTLPEGVISWLPFTCGADQLSTARTPAFDGS